jgi:predicted transcriptional regulator
LRRPDDAWHNYALKGAKWRTRIENGTMDPRFSTMTGLNEAIRTTGVEMAEDVNGTVRISISRDKLLPPSD